MFSKNLALLALALPAFGQTASPTTSVSNATTGIPSLGLPNEIFGLSFSPQCQAAVINVLTNSSLAQCIPVMDLLPLLTSTETVTSVLDNFMTDLCYTYPTCSNTTLSMAAQTITTGCAADLQNDTLSDSVVSLAFSLYPTIREILCLKTSNPYNASSYGGYLGAAPVPIATGGYNSTNGTFCVTSILTQLSAYFGTNITVPFVESAFSGMNTSALNLIHAIQPNVICNDCLFAALEVADVAYPMVGMVPQATVVDYLGGNGTLFGNVTINGFFDQTCMYKNMTVNTNGTLPSDITVSIKNSSFPYTLSNGQMMFAPGGMMSMMRRALFGRKVAN